jgi:transcriptional regulator with XRE-family HTH domain
MKTSLAIKALGAVFSPLVRLGADITTARRLRGISVQLMAERALVGRNTITRLERVDPGVSIGIYATVLFVLGMADRLAVLAALSTDTVGLAQAEARAPKRVRGRQKITVATGEPPFYARVSKPTSAKKSPAPPKAKRELKALRKSATPAAKRRKPADKR